MFNKYSGPLYQFSIPAEDSNLVSQFKPSITDSPTRYVPPFFSKNFSTILQKLGALFSTQSLAAVACSSGELGKRALAIPNI